MSYPEPRGSSLLIDEGPCVAAGTPSLRWLINPVTPQEFLDDYWEKRPLVVSRNDPEFYSGLLSLADVDRVITTLDRRYPDIILKNARRDIPARDYTVNGDRLDVARVYQLFEEGSTITLAFLDTVLPALTLFCRTLESEFSYPFQTNVYLTPPGAQGAKPHYDTHDVYVLQVAGSKEWTIYGTPVESPLPGQDFDAAVHELGAPTHKFVLQAGDVAYIPRGVAHDAHSTDTTSLHITTGVLRYTWTDLLLEMVAHAALNDSKLRRALPPGFAKSTFDSVRAQETARILLQTVSTQSNFEAALDRFVDLFTSTSAPSMIGQMAQLAAMGELTIDDCVGARPGVNFRLRDAEDSVAIECQGRTITFPRFVREALEFALGQPKFRVKELPGGLDDDGKLTLVRRLIREGLVLAYLS